MLQVYGRATSSNVQALVWGLEELGLAYTRLDYGEVYGGLTSAHFQGLTPHGKIPVLVVDGTALWETGAILRYLASAHGPEAFWPSDPLRRAEVDMWAEWAKYSVAAAFTEPVFWQHTRTAPARRDTARIEKNVARLEAELAKADARLASQAFLCGEALSLADIQLGHVLYRYFDIDIARADLPALGSYYEHLTTRQAYQNAVMVSYDSLKDTF